MKPPYAENSIFKVINLLLTITLKCDDRNILRNSFIS